MQHVVSLCILAISLSFSFSISISDARFADLNISQLYATLLTVGEAKLLRPTADVCELMLAAMALSPRVHSQDEMLDAILQDVCDAKTQAEQEREEEEEEQGEREDSDVQTIDDSGDEQREQQDCAEEQAEEQEQKEDKAQEQDGAESLGIVLDEASEQAVQVRGADE